MTPKTSTAKKYFMGARPVSKLFGAKDRLIFVRMIRGRAHYCFCDDYHVIEFGEPAEWIRFTWLEQTIYHKPIPVTGDLHDA